jgi:hypothetical protein
MAPGKTASRQFQGLRSQPACDLDVSQPVACYRLKGREQVGVAGEQDQGVVPLSEGGADEVNREVDVDAFLLRGKIRPAAIVELSADYMHPAVARPLSCLNVVGASRYRLALGIRTATIDVNPRGCAGPASASGDQIAQKRWVGNTLVWLDTVAEEVVPGEMDVLEVQEHCDVLSHETSPENKKTPPIPEDGGE